MFGAQHGEGAGLQGKLGRLIEWAGRRVHRRSVEDALPAQLQLPRAEAKLDRLVVGVEKEGEGVTNDPFPLFVRLADLVPKQAHAENAGVTSIPIRVGHFGSVGLDPVNVLDVRAMNRPPLEKTAPAKNRLGLAKSNYGAPESEQSALIRGEIPVEPRDG